jgi:hypothetical protein
MKMEKSIDVFEKRYDFFFPKIVYDLVEKGLCLRIASNCFSFISLIHQIHIQIILKL